jgi:hypothetical protein
MIYLASTTSIPEKYQPEFGVMFSALYPVGSLNDALDNGWKWMMDNNNFNNKFTAEVWIKALIKYLPYKNNCVGIPIPDIVGDALVTIRQFSQYWRIVHDLGYPVAFVSQDGITPEITPWDYFEVLFVGGTDDHKLHNEAGIMIAEAKERGKWVHVGRVNSPKRIKKFWMCDSVDGTELTSIRSRKNGELREERLEKQIIAISNVVQYCNNKKSGRLGTNGQTTILEVLE